MTQAPVTDASSAKAYVWWSLVNLFLAVTAIGVTLWAFTHERDLRRELVRLTAAKVCPVKVISADKPPIVDESPTPAPPQDHAKSGYIGPSGTSIVAAMTLELEALRADRPEGPVERVRLGSQEVLPSRTIHVVNLWATWCPPCLEELPDFNAMFARRADWGDRVRFVPIMLKDGAAPETAYRDKVMPPAPYMLADRSYGDSLAAILTADEQIRLFKGNLPVTLVLDCNRRVRWAHFDKLQRGHFKALEGYIDRFIEEIGDTSPGAWCAQEWPGNGRCEHPENTERHHSLADCGPLKKVSAAVEPPPAEPLLPARDACPPRMVRGADGKCLRELRGSVPTQPKTPTVATCGDGVCNPPDETTASCCVDCPCDPQLTCRVLRDGASKCMARGPK